MAINKIPKNYYSDTNIRRDKINEIIDEVNDIASIPSPSAADAGKVVKVSGEGSYELAQDAGAKELIVTLSSNFTADKTYTEILTALNSGDIVKVIDWTGRNYVYTGMTSGRVCFAYLNGNVNTQVTDVYTAAVDDTNTWELFLDDITDLPDYSSADAGKVLTVDNAGALEFANVPSELPTVTSADEGKVLTVDNNGAWGASSMASGVDIYLARLDNPNAPTTLTLLRDKTYLNIKNTIRKGSVVLIWGVTADNPNTICNIFYVCDNGYKSGKVKLFSMSNPNNILVFENDTSNLAQFNKMT